MQAKPSNAASSGISATLPASYALAEPDDGPVPVYRCRTRAISLDHIVIEAETSPPKGTKVYLNLTGLGVCVGIVSEVISQGFVLSIALDPGAIAKLIPLGTQEGAATDGESLRVFATLPACYSIVSDGSKNGPATVYPCRTRAIAPDRIVVEAETPPPRGTKLYLNISGLGVCRARVSKTLSNGFVVTIALDAEVIGKLMPRLDWLKRYLAGTADDERGYPRFPAPGYPARLSGENGLVAQATVQDLSRSGLAVLTDANPAIGAHLMLGTIPGRVVRLFEGGLAMRFDAPRPIGDLRERLFPQ